MKIRHCQKCKKTEDLHINASSFKINGEIRHSYICRNCASERAREYRKTKRGKDVYRDMMRR